MPSKLTSTAQRKVVESYASGLTLAEAAKKVGMSLSAAWRCVSKSRVAVRPRAKFAKTESERRNFIKRVLRDYANRLLTVDEITDKHGISRKTVYKWISVERVKLRRGN